MLAILKHNLLKTHVRNRRSRGKPQKKRRASPYHQLGRANPMNLPGNVERPSTALSYRHLTALISFQRPYRRWVRRVRDGLFNRWQVKRPKLLIVRKKFVSVQKRKRKLRFGKKVEGGRFGVARGCMYESLSNKQATIKTEERYKEFR